MKGTEGTTDVREEAGWSGSGGGRGRWVPEWGIRNGCVRGMLQVRAGGPEVKGTRPDREEVGEGWRL